MIAVMPDHAQALGQEASVARFSVDGHDCFIVPEEVSATTRDVRVVGRVTLGRRRYAICSNRMDTHAPPADILTARELQIAVLIAQGFDNKAIGRRLGISALTVGTHRARTYSKLGVSSRVALAVRIAGTVALHRQPGNAPSTADRALPTQ